MSPSQFKRTTDDFVEECCKLDSPDVEVGYALLDRHNLYAKVTLTTPLGKRTFLVRPMFWNPFDICIEVEGKRFFANSIGLYKALWYDAELRLLRASQVA